MGTPAHTFFGTVSDMQHAAVNVSSSGNTTIVAAVAGKSIMVMQYDLVAAGDVAVTFQSSGGTVVNGPRAFAANGGISSPYAPHGHFKTAKGEGLVLNLGGAVQVGGSILYGLV